MHKESHIKDLRVGGLGGEGGLRPYASVIILDMEKNLCLHFSPTCVL